MNLSDVAAHNSPSSCWVIINNLVYDVTDFLQEHPGGAKIILKYAGQDATSAYVPIHPSDALDTHLPANKHLGPLDAESAKQLAAQRSSKKKSSDEHRVISALAQRPPLKRILNLDDLEAVAKQVLSHKAWAYYSSAADEETTNDENRRAFSRFFFHARVMRPVSQCDPSTRILGFPSALPVFVSGAALAKLGHPLGEVNITRAVRSAPLIQMVSSNASLSPAEIISESGAGQTLFFQLYKNKDDAVAEKRVRDVEGLGYKAIWLTVDAVVPGNRERDVRSDWEVQDLDTKPAVYHESDQILDENSFGTAGALIASDDRDMTWERTIPWLRSITKLPLVVKGIQCVEDAVLAVEAGVDGILLSNHGGRQLEFSYPPMELLYKLRLQRPDVFEKVEVYIDGGIRRGTDIIKACCLGATAVGMGRPFLYALSAYGEIGVTKLIRILSREVTTGMALLGARSISDLKPEMVERVDWQPIARPKL